MCGCVLWLEEFHVSLSCLEECVGILSLFSGRRDIVALLLNTQQTKHLELQSSAESRYFVRELFRKAVI